MAETVKVMVRCRPMNRKEKDLNCGSCVGVNRETLTIELDKPNDKDAKKIFTYDYVMPPDIRQQLVYEETTFGLVESVCEGFNGTVFAYGQTGCGKSFSMSGVPSDPELKGIIPRSFEHIINIVESAHEKKFLVRCSYLEIYNECVRDLLSKDPSKSLEVKEHPDKGVYVKDLEQNIVKSVNEMNSFMDKGYNNRSVGATAMNADSSRSHSIFTLNIECEEEIDGNQRIFAGKLNLVDLAGSERQGKTQATGDRLKEATKINLSLSALGNVISALVDGNSKHIPYRDSKLTRLLQDSLGGNTKTIMIAAVSPADYNYDETLSTLRYASRAKNIKNKPTVNQDPKDALLSQYADEIKKLKEMLTNQAQGGGGQPSSSMTDSIAKNPSIRRLQMNDRQMSIGTELINLKQNQGEVEENNKKFQDKLAEQEQALLNEQEQKANLQAQLELMQNQLMTGGTTQNENQEENKPVDEEAQNKYKALKSKMKEEKDKQRKILKEKQKQEEELLNMEKNYESLQDQVQEYKIIIKELRVKYKRSENEIKDINKEFEYNKEELLDNIRQNEKEVLLYKAICQIMLSEKEIDIIKSASEYKEEENEYKVPVFQFKNKKVQFPKVNPNAAMDMIRSEQDARDIEIVNGQQQKSDKKTDFSKFDDIGTGGGKNLNKTSLTKLGNDIPQQTDRMMCVNNALRDLNNDPNAIMNELKSVQPKYKKQGTLSQKKQIPKVQLEPLGPTTEKINKSKIGSETEINPVFMDHNKIPRDKSHQQLQPLRGVKIEPTENPLLQKKGSFGKNNDFIFTHETPKMNNKNNLPALDPLK